MSVPVNTNKGAAPVAAPAVRSPLSGVGEALNPSKFDGDNLNDDGDRRGGFNHGKNPNQFSHLTIENYLRTDPFRGGGGAKYHLDLCFYLGDDVKSSHVMCNANWNNDTAEGWAQYIDDLGYATEAILSESLTYSKYFPLVCYSRVYTN